MTRIVRRMRRMCASCSTVWIRVLWRLVRRIVRMCVCWSIIGVRTRIMRGRGRRSMPGDGLFHIISSRCSIVLRRADRRSGMMFINHGSRCIMGLRRRAMLRRKCLRRGSHRSRLRNGGSCRLRKDTRVPRSHREQRLDTRPHRLHSRIPPSQTRLAISASGTWTATSTTTMARVYKATSKNPTNAPSRKPSATGMAASNNSTTPKAS